MKLAKMFIALVAVLLFSGAVYAANGVDLEYIKVDGDTVEANDNLRVELGEDIDIRVKLQATQDVEDVEVQARIVGYEYNDVQTLIDTTRPFDLEQNDTEIVDLALSIPIRAEKDEYELRVTVSDRTTDFVRDSFTLRVKGPRNGINIRDVVFSPRGEVIAGRALLAQVRLENIGERDLDDVKVIADIPGLGVSGEVFLDDELEGSKAGDGDKDITEEIFIRIPQCADPGLYDVEIMVEFDEYDVVQSSETIRVVSGDNCVANQPTSPQAEQRTLVTPPPAQDVVAGQSGATYPIIITNLGSEAEFYTLSVRGVDGWGAAEVTDAAPIVQAGESKTVYVYVSANEDAAEGQHVFTVAIERAGRVQEVPLTANVAAGEENLSSVRRGLEIGLVVLIVLLVILGLIIGLNKLKGNDDDEDMKGQAYY